MKERKKINASRNDNQVYLKFYTVGSIFYTQNVSFLFHSICYEHCLFPFPYIFLLNSNPFNITFSAHFPLAWSMQSNTSPHNLPLPHYPYKLPSSCYQSSIATCPYLFVVQLSLLLLYHIIYSTLILYLFSLQRV